MRLDDPPVLHAPTAAEVLRRATEHNVRFVESLDNHPVGADTSAAGIAELRALLGGPLPTRGADALAVVDTLARGARRGVVRSVGGRMFGYVVGGALPVAQAADAMVSTWDQFAATFDASPATTIAEETALDWLVDLLGLGASGRPISSGFTNGSTEAHLVGIAAARHRLLARRGWDVENDGLWGAPPLDVVVGEDVHVSVLAVLQYLGMGRRRVHRVATDDEARMRPAALRATLAGLAHPPLVILQAGEINHGSFDPLDELVTIIHEHDGWAHVDGAFGLFAAAAPELAHLTAGMERADSWVTDSHKMGQTPHAAGMVFTADPEAHRAAMTTQAAYTTVGPSALAARQHSGMDWCTGMARRANGVPLWANLAHLGRDGFAEVVVGCHRRAVEMATALDGDPDVRIVNRVRYNQVLIDPDPKRPDADSEAFVQAVCDAVRDEGTCWIGGTRWRGRAYLRVSVANAATTAEDIERSAKAILAAVARVQPVRRRATRGAA
jgi:glutamate/tyrosine decarboxylase-like PLP-dependent enzyme